MIENYHLPINVSILDVGVGTSLLIDHLVESGYADITAVDINAQAIEKLKVRLENE